MTYKSFVARVAKGMGALAGLVLLLVGVPFALGVFVGWPLPHGVPSWSELGSALTSSGIPDEVLVKGLAVAFWLAWSGLSASVVAEIVGRARGRQARRIPWAGPLQGVAAHLVAAVLMLLPLAQRMSTMAAPPLVVTLARSGAEVATSRTEPLPASAVSAVSAVKPRPEVGTMAVQTAVEEYVVQPRDTLWAIAEVRLGDPYRWPELFEANRGRPQPDGAALLRPGVIRPGWVLSLPSVEAASSEAAPSSSPVASEPPRQDGPETVTTGGPAALESEPGGPVVGQRPVRSDDTSVSNHRSAPSAPGVRLPSGSVVSLSLAAGIGASLAASRLHRRRLHEPAEVGEGIVFGEALATASVRRLRRAAMASRTEHSGSRKSAPPATSAGLLPAEGREPRTVDTVRSGDARAPLDLTTCGGIGLRGPGAVAVVRAAVVECLSNGPAHSVEVVVAGDELAGRLCPDVGAFFGYEVAESLDGAITRLEVELIHRRRLTDGDEAADFAAVLARYPEEPLPSLVLLADGASAGQRRRLQEVLNSGTALGIGAVVLDPWEDLAGLSVAEDGSTGSTSGDERFEQLHGARLFSLEMAEASELLAVVAAGRGQTSTVSATPEPEPEPFEVEAVAAGPVQVEVLGPYRIVVQDREITIGLRAKARELLALLLLHPAGRSAESAIDALWPDAEPKRGMDGFKTATSNLRRTLRDALGDPGAEVVERAGGRYRLVSSAFDCDLWRFEKALADVRNGARGDSRLASLERAAAAYGGDLVDGSYYEWAEAACEDLRRRAVDVLVKLAELQEADADPDDALATMERVIRIDPYGEDPYRRLMSLQLRLDRSDAVRRTFRQLEARLGELDVDPDDRTLDILAAMPARRGAPVPAAAAQGSARS